MQSIIFDDQTWKQKILHHFGKSGKIKKQSKSRSAIDTGGKMKKMMKTVLFGAVMLGVGTLMGAEFRVDIQVDKDICGLTAKDKSEGVRIDKAGWKKEKADRRLLIIGNSGKKWKEKWIHFIPAEDCSVSVQLMSNAAKEYVAFDNIRIEGASVKNGSFEELNSKGTPQGWYGKNILKKGGAADGENYVEVFHNGRAFQTITCKKGQPVKITFMVRDAKRATDVK